MDHAVKRGDRLVGIRQQREVQRLTLRFPDIGGPFFLGVQRIDRQAENLDIALFPFGLQAGDFTEFGGADRREILGMAEQDSPGAAKPFVKMDRAFGRVLGEIGGNLTKLQ